jgi:ribA/ribD-fused uncharacterized protein
MLDKETFVAGYQPEEPPTFIFFWGNHPGKDGSIGKQCLSQWWACQFVKDGVEYLSAEHYMMAEKARLFGDLAALERILAARDPDQAKRLGRGVKNFQNDVWEKYRIEIVLRGNEAKFGQNGALKKYLLGTGDAVLVEASPLDTIWGIGLAHDHPGAADPRQWLGLNLLGFVLMEVRTRLRKG